MTLNDLKSAWATPPTGLPNSPAAADRADSLAVGGPDKVNSLDGTPTIPRPSDATRTVS